MPSPRVLATLGLMLAKVFSCAVVGLEGALVEVEVDTANGLQVLWTSSLEPTSMVHFMERLGKTGKGAGLG